jgi:REP element-mobilizing transposase RayT
LAPWKDSSERPVIYHCVSRVVDRRFVFGDEEREVFRKFMRMQEKFSGCRVLAYCVMSNHFHLLLEVPPMAEGGLSDEELFERLSATHTEAFIYDVAKELAEARKQNRAEWVAEIHGRFTYRMHDLSEFMKTLLQRFTRWFNRCHQRTGTLWEDRFKSVIVQDGTAARTMAAYIDLNPVRAGLVKDPAEYRWSSYGEAIGGGAKGNGKRARAGLVRAWLAHKGVGADAGHWARNVSRSYRALLMAGSVERTTQRVVAGKVEKKVVRKGIKRENVQNPEEEGEEIPMATVLRCRVRYFTDGAVIGSKAFVNEAFAASRERFSERRKDGARRMRGGGAGARDALWTARDLRVRV